MDQPWHCQHQLMYRPEQRTATSSIFSLPLKASLPAQPHPRPPTPTRAHSRPLAPRLLFHSPSSALWEVAARGREPSTELQTPVSRYKPPLLISQPRGLFSFVSGLRGLGPTHIANSFNCKQLLRQVVRSLLHLSFFSAIFAPSRCDTT